MEKWSLLLLCPLVLVGLTVSSFADLRLEGYYEAGYEKRWEEANSSRGGNLGFIKHYFEFKNFGHPAPGLDAYFKIGAEANEANSFPHIYLKEGNIVYRRNRFEGIFYSNSWFHSIDEPLLNLMGGRAKDDGTQGIRVNFWDLKGFRGALFANRFSQKEDSAYLIRLQRRMNKYLDLGTTYIFQDWPSGTADAKKTYNRVYAGDIKISWRDVDLTTEYAESEHPSTIVDGFQSTSFSGWLKRKRFDGGSMISRELLPKAGENSAVLTEIRGLKAGPLQFLFSYRSFGKNFRDELSDRFSFYGWSKEFDRHGVYGQVFIPVPRKAINLILRHDRYYTSFDPDQNRFLEDGSKDPLRYGVKWSQVEVQVEFEGGIKGRSFYEVYKNSNPIWEEEGRPKVTEHVFAELLSENEVVLVKFQLKVKDIGQVEDLMIRGNRDFGRRTIFGAEVRANLTGNWQAYTRLATVDAKVEEWASLMAYLGYRPSPSVEMFLEFGSPWDTDRDLVNDDDVADNVKEIEERLFLMVKVFF